MDQGQKFGPYQDNGVYDQTLSVSAGTHTINYFDLFSDGWNDGYWEVFTVAADNSTTHVAGGPTDGLVTGSGGETTFTVGGGGAATTLQEGSVTVHIHTEIWANEITWNMDGGSTFGALPLYSHVYATVVPTRFSLAEILVLVGGAMPTELPCSNNCKHTNVPAPAAPRG